MRFYTLCLLLLGVFPAWLHAETSAELEQRVKSKLDVLLQRILPEQKYVLQVVAQGSSRMERELVEGESTSNTPARAASLPALPGFSVKPSEAAAGAGTVRQTFRMRERFELKNFSVQLLADESLPEDLVKKATEIVKSYLDIEFPGKYLVTSPRAKLLQPAGLPWWNANWLPWGLAALALVAAAGFYFYWRARANLAAKPEREFFPEVMDGKPVTDLGKGVGSAGGALAMAPSQLPLPKVEGENPDPSGAHFPALPATEEFSDRRAELLENFLANAEIFRVYYQKLTEGSRAELYSGLRGPAFDSLIENMGLAVPTDVIPSVSPTEGQIGFYVKNFREFLKSFEWEEKQFFGFLQHLDDSQILQLSQQQNSVVLSVILNFLGPERSAKVLENLDSQLRVQVLTQLDRCRNLPLEELREIEKNVRVSAGEMPRLGSFHQSLDLKFWAKVLGRVENQEQILLDLEQVMPELYAKLARFRFKLEDMPMLPKALVNRILDQVENDELSAAMVGMEPSLVDFMLGTMSHERRGLVEGQVLVNQGLPLMVTEEHKSSLTRRFREVMA